MRNVAPMEAASIQFTAGGSSEEIRAIKSVK
jgi:hypothetical protein